jgi:hypothetical protein
MRTVRSLSELAAVFDMEFDESTRVIRDRELDEPLVIEGVHADRLELRTVIVDRQVVFRDCAIETLIIERCLSSSILLANCRITHLAVRKLPARQNVTITRGHYAGVEIHDVGEISVTDVECTGPITITAPRRDIHLERVGAGHLTIAEHISARSTATRMTLKEVEIVGNLQIRDLHVTGLVFAECSVGRHLLLQRLTVEDTVRMRRLRCMAYARMDCLTSSATVEIIDSRFNDGLDARQMAHRAGNGDQYLVKLVDSTVSRSLQFFVETTPVRILLQDTVIAGRLNFPDEVTQYVLVGATSISDLDVPSGPMRTTRAIRSFVRQRFGSDDPLGFSTLRAALTARHRIAEGDICYFMQRNAEATDNFWINRLAIRGILGGIFGWGVRWLQPLRTLIIGIVLTGLLLFARDSRSTPAVVRLIEDLVLSAALWFNVGTGSPQLLTTTTWAAVATALTAAGLVLITVLVGITIRRLVR